MPTVGQIGLADFHRASEAIDIGYAETVKRLEDIKRLQGISG
jgi:NTE family protein